MKVLCLGAHPDDCEMGMGGTIFKLSKHNQIDVSVLSSCEDEVPKGWLSSTLEIESVNALKKLGVNDISFEQFPNKRLEESRQKILDIFYELKQSDYDTVFCPSSFNSNQDHITVYNEAKRAFRCSSLLGYQTPSSDYSFASSPVYSVLSKEACKRKLQALQCFRSQKELRRPYIDSGCILALMKVAGMEIWKEYAEKFEPIRMVI